jgi:hypothetical protein
MNEEYDDGWRQQMECEQQQWEDAMAAALDEPANEIPKPIELKPNWEW